MKALIKGSFLNHDLRKIYLWEIQITLSGKTGHGVADSPASPGKMGLPLRREPGKMGCIRCQTSDKIP
ncbi:hypothetical protein HanRHA438_Chr09g0401001 [Helianthus annuus]|nr:hypothetical protein HanRHA438_Chr09g0401001 [Helianthus annuus]